MKKPTKPKDPGQEFVFESMFSAFEVANKSLQDIIDECGEFGLRPEEIFLIEANHDEYHFCQEAPRYAQSELMAKKEEYKRELEKYEEKLKRYKNWLESELKKIT